MSNLPLDIIRRRRVHIESQGLGRALMALEGVGKRVTLDGRELLLMASNDFLGLAGHPRLCAAAKGAIERWGTSSSASRLISGTRTFHADLEERIAAFVGCEAALFFSTGTLTNLGLMSALADEGDLIVADALNHASLIDACRLSRAERRIYGHVDVAAAAGLLSSRPSENLTLLVTDGVFSMDGDPAPIPDLLGLARQHEALLVIDDSHAFGVWGPRGRGTLDHFGLTPDAGIVLVGTFSKALGGHGGFAAGSRVVIDMLIQRARSFLYGTAPPPAQVAAATEALSLVDDEAWRRQRLTDLCQHARDGLKKRGLSVMSAQGPILPLFVGEAERAVAAAVALCQRGIYVTAIRPPTVPAGTSRLRLTLNARLDEADVDYVLDQLAEVLA